MLRIRVTMSIRLFIYEFLGRKLCDIPVPKGLFKREVYLTLGRSMRKRVQMDGRSLEEREVSDRLLLSY